MASNRLRRRLEYQGSLEFRGREGEGPGASGKEAEGRRKGDKARGKLGSVGAKIGCRVHHLLNKHGRPMRLIRRPRSGMRPGATNERCSPPSSDTRPFGRGCCRPVSQRGALGEAEFSAPPRP